MAKPIIKAVGGKSQLLPALCERLPLRFDRYVEPFVGGGALFFELYERGLTDERTVLADSNESLINLYQVVQRDPTRLLRLLQGYRFAHSKDLYSKVRAQFNRPDRKADVDRWAAMFVYLNKTCFNGLYRENKSGAFNVPMGKYKNPNICDTESIEAAHIAFKGIQIVCCGFEATRGLLPVDLSTTFVYFDPPYEPISKTSNFTQYRAGGFSQDAQRDLARMARRMSDHGAYVMASNSDCAFIRELWTDAFEDSISPLTIDVVGATRSVNAKGGGRGKINELIMTNY